MVNGDKLPLTTASASCLSRTEPLAMGSCGSRRVDARHEHPQQAPMWVLRIETCCRIAGSSGSLGTMELQDVHPVHFTPVIGLPPS